MGYKDKARDREWHRLKMRERRDVTPKPLHPVTPNKEKLQRMINDIERGASRLHGKENTGFAESVQPIPMYNPSVHKAGDRVMIRSNRKLIETVIPELDGSGQPIPEY